MRSFHSPRQKTGHLMGSYPKDVSYLEANWNWLVMSVLRGTVYFPAFRYNIFTHDLEMLLVSWDPKGNTELTVSVDVI